MASIRRTLSLMPRPGISLSEEACSVAPSLYRWSSFNESQPPSGGLPSPPFGSLDSALYRIQSFVPTLFSPGSRFSERSKFRGQSLRKILFNFLTCFVIGIFVGFIQFISWDLSKEYTSIHKSFFLEVFPPVGEVQLPHIWSKSVAISKGRSGINDNSTSDSPLITRMLGNEISDTNILNQSLNQDLNMFEQKLLIIVTPTHAHPFQAYYLNRLAHTLGLVSPPVLWIVVDEISQSVETSNLLRRTGVLYRHLVCTKNMTEIKDRRVQQRNTALSHIEVHRLDGIVYFADEVNIYSTDLFEQMRQIRRFGTWLVAKLTQNESQPLWEGPSCNDSRVFGWQQNEETRPQRFNIDMSGFAFNSTILFDPVKWRRPTIEPVRHLDAVEEEFQASMFVEQVVTDESQMQGLPQNCSKIMVWRPHIEISYSLPPKWLLKNDFFTLTPLALSFEVV